MHQLTGPITSRLLLQFGVRVAEWPAHRRDDVIRDMPEENYTGRTLGPRYRYIGQHRQETPSE